MPYLESDLSFEFGSDWIVVRWDRHRFYRWLSGRGYRGVDFLLLHVDLQRAILLEVKNYRRRHLDQAPQRLAQYERNPGELALQLAGKFTSTKLALQQIEEWYRSKWWRYTWGQIARWLALLSQGRFKRWLLGVDHVFFPLLATAVNPFYLIVLETDTHYEELGNFDSVGFGESLNKVLSELSIPAQIGSNAELKHWWS